MSMVINEKIFKALANKTRLDILKWLKNPEEEITSVSCDTVRFMMEHRGGICVMDIVTRANMTQSTVSTYLKMLLDAGLLISERHGKWTYYRRNEENIKELGKLIQKEL
ncbi:metalloregulator ArsR/SmtB family transcription factor [Lactobacillus mulieris]|nr:metalloregulator ArsR/SmtB family transcription factor [Lactobacillus mulieris]MDT9621032.1 metalloregulator ArsR/SmtB family transcription factor [Lactobacillus mulieris]